MPHQVALTIHAPLEPGGEEGLQEVFRSMHEDVDGNAVLPFESLRGVHFARLAVIPPDEGHGVASSLVWASSADAPRDAHLDDIVAVAGDGLDRIFGRCEGYPRPEERSRASRRAFLREHVIPVQAFYVNTVGRSVDQIRFEAELHDRIEEYLDEQHSSADSSPRTPEDVRSGIIGFVRSRPELQSALKPASKPPLSWRIKERARFALIILAGILLIPVLIFVVPIGILAVRMKEKQDARSYSAPDRRFVSRGELAEREDFAAQNQFTASGSLKPGIIRYVAAHTILRLAGVGTRHIFTKEDLGTFRLLGLHGVNTIHFARWVSIDRGRRLFFMSNYDGSLESYMDDFINKVAWGLNGVFSHAPKYPLTRWLVLDGAKDEQAFKAFLRAHQSVSEVWFSGYPHLTASNIANNAVIRAGLSKKLEGAAVEEWLRRL